MNPIILNNLPNILGFIVITLFVFILIRELVCWYFKVNERVQLQKESNANQKEIIRLIMYQQGLDKFDRLYEGGKVSGDRS